MICEHCRQTVGQAQVVVRIATGGNVQLYHAVPGSDEDLSCWQQTVLAWSHAIKTVQLAIRGDEDAGSHNGSPASLRTAEIVPVTHERLMIRSQHGAWAVSQQ